MWYVGSSSLTRDQTWAALHWECGALTPGPPGKSLDACPLDASSCGCFLWAYMSLVSLLCAKLSSSYTDISPVGLEPTLMDSWTHLEPDILECEVKWALGSITKNKANRGNGIPAKLF